MLLFSSLGLYIVINSIGLGMESHRAGIGDFGRLYYIQREYDGSEYDDHNGDYIHNGLGQSCNPSFQKGVYPPGDDGGHHSEG